MDDVDKTAVAILETDRSCTTMPHSHFRAMARLWLMRKDVRSLGFYDGVTALNKHLHESGCEPPSYYQQKQIDEMIEYAKLDPDILAKLSELAAVVVK